MAGSKTKRNRTYKPKHVRIPVTSLRHEFGLVLHMAVTTARLGYFSYTQYQRIGQAINTIWGALFLSPPKDKSMTLVVEGAMRAMNEAGTRGDKSGVWELRELEQAAVLAGIAKIEEQLPKMDVMVLYQSMQMLKELKIEEDRDAKKVFLGEDYAGGPDRAAKITAILEDGSLTNIDISEIKRINIVDETTGEVIHIERKAA